MITYGKYINPNIALDTRAELVEKWPVPLINEFDTNDPMKDEITRFTYTIDSQYISPRMRNDQLKIVKETIGKFYNQKIFKKFCKCTGKNSKCSHPKDCECSKNYKLSNIKGEEIILLRKQRFDQPNRLLRECTVQCNCDPYKCINRLVGNASGVLQVKVRVERTEKMGWGLFADQDILEGQFIGNYSGELCLFDSMKDMNVIDSYFFSVYPDINNFIKGNKNNSVKSLHIDARKYGNCTRFINHSCAPNLDAFHTMIFIDYDDLENSNIPVISFFACKKIKKGEQFFVDYSESYWRVMNDQGIFCYCGSKRCNFSEKSYNKKWNWDR